MKNVFTYVLIMLLLVALFGCRGEQPPEEIPFSAETLYTEFTSISEGGHGVLDVTFNQREEPEVYINENAAPTKTVEVLGVSYELTYKESVLFGNTEVPADVYVVPNMEIPSGVYFNADTGEIIRYHYMPYTAELATEQEYLAFIETVLGHEISDEYDYACTTHYYEKTENEFRSRVEDGFIVCEGNRELGDYSFYYTKSLNGVKLPDHISANFLDGYFLLEMMETEEDSDKYSNITSNIDRINEHIQDSISQHINDGYVCKKIDIVSHSIVFEDNAYKVLSNIEITFSLEDMDGDLVMILQTTTGWNQSE